MLRTVQGEMKSIRKLLTKSSDLATGDQKQNGYSKPLRKARQETEGRSERRCYHCHKLGHIARDCPRQSETAVQAAMENHLNHRDLN